MNQQRSHLLLTLGVLGYATWNVQELVATWFNSPYNHLSWLAFTLWLGAPLLGGAMKLDGNLRWLAAALWVSAIGLLADMRVLHGLALALAIASLVNPGRLRWKWGWGFLSWTPALGWLLLDLPASIVVAVRLALALASWSTWIVWNRRIA